MLYTVGEMAKKFNVAPSTLRYYDKEGLLPFVERASAFLSVSKYYGIEPNVILLVSDKHPINKEDKNWNWGNSNFKSIKNKFIINSVCNL